MRGHASGPGLHGYQYGPDADSLDPPGINADAKITEVSERELTRLLVILPDGSPAPPSQYMAGDGPCRVMLRLVLNCL